MSPRNPHLAFPPYSKEVIVHSLILEQAEEISPEGKISSLLCSDLFRFSAKIPNSQLAFTLNSSQGKKFCSHPAAAAAFLTHFEVSEGSFPLLDSGGNSKNLTPLTCCSCNYHPSSQKNKISLILHLKINPLLSRKEPNHHLTSWKWSFESNK